jgi:hypothetical protein
MHIDSKNLGTMSNKRSDYIVADVWVGEGGFGEKSTLFNPKINHWLIWESTKMGGGRKVRSPAGGRRAFF